MTSNISGLSDMDKKWNTLVYRAGGSLTERAQIIPLSADAERQSESDFTLARKEMDAMLDGGYNPWREKETK